MEMAGKGEDDVRGLVEDGGELVRLEERRGEHWFVHDENGRFRRAPPDVVGEPLQRLRAEPLAAFGAAPRVVVHGEEDEMQTLRNLQGQ